MSSVEGGGIGIRNVYARYAIRLERSIRMQNGEHEMGKGLV